jgi:hypothetical protein
MGSIVALLLSASIAMPPAASAMPPAGSRSSCNARAPLVVNDDTIEATAPFGSALVLLYSQDKLVRFVFADEHARFTLDNLAPGGYRLDMLSLGSVNIEVRPKAGQRFYYGFYPYDGCLSWGASTN